MGWAVQLWPSLAYGSPWAARMSSREDQGLGKVEIEDAEDELEKGVQGPKDHICDWADLWSDIKELDRKSVV